MSQCHLSPDGTSTSKTKTDIDRLRRVAEQLVERAAVSERSADDRPVLDDLGSAPRPDLSPPERAGPDRPGERARRGAARTAARRIADRARLHTAAEPSRGPRWSGPEPTGGGRSYSAAEPPGRGNGWAEPEPPRRDRGLER
jgi:hypothetical protein